MSNFLSSLKASIKTGKIRRAKEILSTLKDCHSTEKEEALEQIALASDKTAFELLSFLTDAENQDPEIHDRLIQLTIDRAHLNFKFILILFDTPDTAILQHITPLLKHILSNETDKNLLSRILRTAGKRKLKKLVDDLAEFIFYDDVHLKSDAVNALERIGTPEALEKLVQSSRTEKCDQDILDAIQVLRNNLENEKTDPGPAVRRQPVVEPEEPPFNLEDLRQVSPNKRFQSLTGLIEKDIRITKFFSDNEVRENEELMLNLLWLVSRTIPIDCIDSLFDILSQKKLSNNIKFAVYCALESYPELESAATVIKGISESTMHVRLAAVKVLDKNLSDFACAEIRAKIESGTKTGETLAQTILDAKARNLIEYLMISDTFSYMASNYLSKNAPIPALDTFIDILQRRNLKSTAKKYIDLRTQRLSDNADHFVVISPIEATLNFYSKLIFSCGYYCHPFIKPQEAFEAIVFEKPLCIITDLYLNDLTGFDLAREIRDLYTKKDVPVIISTMQKNFDPEILQKELEDAGVNFLCEFPAKSSQIKSWVK